MIRGLVKKAIYAILLLCCVSNLIAYADSRDIPLAAQTRNDTPSVKFRETINKLQNITATQPGLTRGSVKTPFLELSNEAKVYTSTNQRLERFIGELNSYFIELKTKSLQSGLSDRDIKILRRTFTQLTNIKTSVLDKLNNLSSAVVRQSGPEAQNNVDELIAAIEKNISELETAIAALTTKGTDLTPADFDSIIELTKRQKSDQTDNISITPLELRASVPDTSGVTTTPLSPPDILAALAPPTPDDLLETIEVQFTPEIVALANSLNNSPIKIYEYVRNQVEFEPYFGSRKGGAATLLSKRGNDYDQASLLLALLRSSGISARYVRGTVEVPVARVLDWLGLKDANVPNTVLNTAGINAVPVVGGGGSIEVYRIDRVWVAAYIPFNNYRGTNADPSGMTWVPLDPAFYLSQYQPGVTNATDSVPFDESTYLSAVRTETAADYYRDQMFDYLATSLPGTSLVEVPYAGNPISQNFGILPASLPYTVLSIAGEFSEVPGTLRHAARIRVSSSGFTLLQTTVLLPQVSLNRKTISFTGATAADQATIDSFGGIANTPPFLVNVKPQLKVEGVLHTDGSSVSLGSGIAVDIGFIEPEAGETDSVSHPFLTAGDFISVNLDVGQATEELITQRTEKLLAALDTIGTPVPDAQQDEVTGELLNIGGLIYWLRMNDANKLLSGLYQYKEVLGVSESLTTSNMEVLYLFDRPYAVMPGNLSLDAARLLHSRFSIDGVNTDQAAFNRLIGIESSAREHAMWEELVSVQSISTIKALQIAGQSGIPVHRFDSSTASGPVTCVADGLPGTILSCMSRCGVSSFTISSISSELSAGKEITTHECVVTLNQWSGVGYISADPVTQAGAYIISGGLNSYQEIGAETTVASANAISQIDSQTGAQIIQELPTQKITKENYRGLLYNLLLPEKLKKHIESLVATDHTATVSEVLVEIDGKESLVYQLDSEALAQSEYYRFDTLNGGSGTENPPGSLDDPDGNTGNGDGTGTAGDPVNIANGSFYREERDFAITALGYPLAFDRFYNSSLTVDGPLGVGWTHTYSDRVIENADGSVTWIDTLGGAYTYLPDGVGGYITPPGVDSSLTQTGTGYTLTSKKDEIQNFNLSGQLTARKNSLNQGVDLTYVSGRLTTVTDSASRSIAFTYHPSGKIETVSDFTGRTWTYSYTNDQLTRVESPSNATTLPMVTQYSYYTGTLAGGLLRTITEPNGGVRRLSYYTNLRVYEVRDPEGGRERFSYDLLTNTTVYTDQRGYRTRYRHNDDGNIVEIRYADGSRERWTWANHQIQSHTDTLGYTETYQYDANRNLIRHTDREGLVTTYDYHPTLGVRTLMTRPGGRVMNYTFNTNGSLERIDDATGGSYTVGTINSFGLPDSATDPRGVTTNTVYNAIGQPEQISVTGEYTVSIEYTPRGKVSRQVDANNHELLMEYDLLDRLVRREDAEGNVTRFEYDAAGRNTKIINPRSYETLFEYDLNDRLIKQTDAHANAIIHNYDLAGNAISEVDRLGRTTTHTYDNRNRRIQTDYPNGTTIQLQYDSENRFIAFIDPNGNKTSYKVDGNGRIAESIDALGRSKYQTYDNNGNIQSVTNRRGAVTSFEYDEFNRITRIDGAEGNLQTRDYDEIGNVTQYARYDIDGLTTVPSDPRTLPASRKRTLNIQYDVRGLPELITDPESGVIQLIRDPKGNVVTSIDQRSKSTSYEYDLIDRLIKITKPDFTEVNITYDENNNLRTITTPNGGVWSWTYDELDRVITATDPLSRTTNFEYDAVGNLVKRTNPDFSTVTYTYDGVNRRAHAARSDGTYTTMMYDSVGNMVLGETEKTILISTFDTLNRLSSEFTAIPDATFSQNVDYGYDFESNLTDIDITGYGAVSYGYDLADRVNSVTNTANSTTVGIGYNGFGDRSSVSYGNGITGTFTYDRFGRLNQSDYGASIAATNYIRDPAGNPTTINETIAGISESLTVVYDDLNRPESSTASVSALRNETFNYDDNGNLTDTGIGNTALYDLADQVSYDGSSTYSTDSRGNTTRKNTLGGLLSDYTYDADNKLIHVRQTSGSTVINEFDNVYDALGRLIQTSANGNPVRRIYARLNPLIDFNPNKSVNRNYTTGPAVDDVFAVSIAGVRHYLHLDPIGSVRATTDSAGLVTGTRDYGQYGRILNQTGTTNVLLGYVGRPFDPTTGLIDLRARWMDPDVGRFTTRDPLPIRPAMPNPYAYADNQPLNFIDPLGLSPESPEDSWLDDLQTGLDLFGLIPGIGEFADGANALIYLARGDYVNAALSGAAMLPIGGQAATAAKLANKGADAVKGVDAANDARRLADNVPTCSGKCDGINCFVKGTEVIAETGEVPIEDIQVGDRVWAYNPETGWEELRTVTKLYRNVKTELVILYVGEEVIETTTEHPFWVVGKEWVEAKDLIAGDVLKTITNGSKIIDRIEYRKGSFKVYNFEVEGLHNYYVSEERVLVHNSCSTDTKVIGRQDDTAVAQDWDGHDVLNDPNWTPERNREWVQEGIDNKQDFYTASPEQGNMVVTDGPRAGEPTVYAQELQQIQDAGYVKQGDTYVHPDNLP